MTSTLVWSPQLQGTVRQMKQMQNNGMVNLNITMEGLQAVEQKAIKELFAKKNRKPDVIHMFWNV